MGVCERRLRLQSPKRKRTVEFLTQISENRLGHWKFNVNLDHEYV
jgi:hypothetical protein